MGLAGRCLPGCYGGRGGARRRCGAALRRAGSAAGPPGALSLSLSFCAVLAMRPGLAPRSPLPALYAALLLLLLLLPPPPAMGAGERRRLACTTCRGIVDRFNQVGGGAAGCRPDRRGAPRQPPRRSHCRAAAALSALRSRCRRQVGAWPGSGSAAGAQPVL